jgi:glycosyltransferase involved in cell wall biosynthesis
MVLHIIQPAVPKYRTAFFQLLKKKYHLNVYSSDIDFLGVKSDKAFEYHSLGLFYKFKFLFWQKGLNLYTNYNLNDIVVINGNPRVLNYMLLFFLLKLRGIKTVWWGHGWSAGSFGLMAKVRIKLMKLSSAVLVYTDKEKDKLAISNSYALNNGLDSSEIEECIKAFGSRKSLNSSKFILVFVGRITDKANFDFLLNAMNMVNKNVHLNVIGFGDKLEHYKALSEELGISGRVHWHGAIFDEIRIAKIMLSSHAFIYTGSVGLSLIHGFNYGLPAIVHSNEKQHMPEFSAFENDVNGLSFEQGNIVDLSSKINGMSTLCNATYNNMSNNALKTITDSYNVDDMATRFSAMVEDLKL